MWNVSKHLTWTFGAQQLRVWGLNELIRGKVWLWRYHGATTHGLW